MLPPLVAHADDTSDDWLAWTAVEGCPTQASFAAKVEAHLGGPGRQAAHRAGVQIRARVERVDRDPGMTPLWLGETGLLDKAGTVVGRRTISKDGSSCADIADGLSLVTALLLSTAPEPSPPAPPPPETPTAAVTAARPPVAVTPWAAKLEGGPSGGAGLLPGLGWAGEVRALLVPPPASRWPVLFARFAWWAESQTTLATGQGATLGLWTAGTGLCPLDRGWGSRSLALCAGMDAGRLRASGFGFNHPSTHALWLVDATAEGEAQQTIGRFFLVLSLRAAVPLLRTRVAYATPTGDVQMYGTWPVATIGHLGLGYRWR